VMLKGPTKQLLHLSTHFIREPIASEREKVRVKVKVIAVLN
jgi:hypothetical protein